MHFGTPGNPDGANGFQVAPRGAPKIPTAGWPRFMRNGFRLKPIPVHNGSGSYRFRSKTNSGSYWDPLGPGPSWALWARAPGPRVPWGPGPVGPFGPRPQGPLAPGPSWPLGASLRAHRHYTFRINRLKHFVSTKFALNISHQIFRLKHFLSNLSP